MHPDTMRGPGLVDTFTEAVLESMARGYPLWLFWVFMGLYAAMACSVIGLLWP